MKKLILLAVAALTLTLLPTHAQAPPQVITSCAMSGAEMLPPNASPFFARTIVTYDVNSGTLLCTLLTGLGTTVTSATVRTGVFGSNGPVLVTMTGGPTLWQGTSGPLAPGELSALLHEGLYAETTSSTFPSGELRGQLQIDLHHQAFLTGAAVNPPVSTLASGLARLTVEQPLGEVEYTIDATGLGATLASHIHSGAVGQQGPIISPLSGSGGSWVGTTSPLTDAALVALLSGDTYINIHTTQISSGELRGQIQSGGLNVDTQAISVTNGGHQKLHLRTNPSFVNTLFLILGSTAGSSPGFMFQGVNIPLNVPNGYFNTTLANPSPSNPFASIGYLDIDGEWQTTVFVPPLSTALAGISVTHAFVGIEFMPLRLTYVSNPVTLNLLP